MYLSPAELPDEMTTGPGEADGTMATAGTDGGK